MIYSKKVTQSGPASTRSPHRRRVGSGRQGEAGQTLIETIIAIFLLTTALSGGLALAIYAFSTSSKNFNQIVATNLAREGIEVMRMMRDSNWLAANASGASFDLQPCPGQPMLNKLCYPLALNGPNFNINPQNNQAVSRGINFASITRSWDLINDYFLFIQPDGSFARTSTGLNNWIYSRKITISFITNGEYSPQYPGVVIRSIVGWIGKGCTPMDPTTGDPEVTNCKIVAEEHLTNWKDYQ